MKLLRKFWIDDGTTDGVEILSSRELWGNWSKQDEAQSIRRDLENHKHLAYETTSGAIVVINSARVAAVMVSEVES